jgi:hypothetical protein
VSDDKKRPYERPTLEGKEMFGAEGLGATCCKVTIATCSAAQKTGMGKGSRSSVLS